MEQRLKVVRDYILVTKESIFILQQWLVWLELAQGYGQAEVGEFEALCQQMREAGLGTWLKIAGGYDLKTLRQAIAEPVAAEAVEMAEWR